MTSSYGQPQPFSSQYADQFEALLAVGDEGSFAAAARRLQRHPTIVSKRIAELERRLGVRLIERTTRKLSFTESGLRYLQRLREAREMLIAAEDDIASSASRASGLLRLALPGALGRIWLAPLIAQFAREHPDVSIYAEYSDAYVDLIKDGFDAAIRVGSLGDSRLKATRLCANDRILCASPSYIARAGLPAVPGDLRRHNCLGFTGLANFPDWVLSQGSERIAVPVKGTLQSNDNEALLAAAIEGLGIVAGGTWLFSKTLDEKKLLHVLPGWRVDSTAAIYFLRPSSKLAPAKTRIFKKWIEDRFATGTPWRQR